ncbi:MAG: hypothetical protein P8144_05640 [Gammaproteobacteria bacterium]
MSLLDFSEARQCWQAAHWSLLALGRCFSDAHFDGEGGGEDVGESDAGAMRASLDLESPGTLVPELDLYGAVRVTPVLAYPIYDWLYRAHYAVAHAVAGYYKADVQVNLISAESIYPCLQR